jgi:hypothetical protein
MVFDQWPKGVLVYLASPYTHPDWQIRERRFASACKAVARLMGWGVVAYSPVAYTHSVAINGNCPVEWQHWIEFDLKFLSLCSVFSVLMLPGWEISSGIRIETAKAQELGKPIYYLRPEDLLLS